MVYNILQIRMKSGGIMNSRKICKNVSLILSFVILSMSLSACKSKEEKFSEKASTYLNDKYAINTQSVLFYAPSNRYTTDINGFGYYPYKGSEFALVKTNTGETVVVSNYKGNYSDSYELMELYEAYFDKMSNEIGADVELAYLGSDEQEDYEGNSAEKSISTFWERNSVRYNASNVDEFEDALYNYMHVTTIYMYITESCPSDEWLADLKTNLIQYQKNHNTSKIEANVLLSEPDIYLPLDAVMYTNHQISFAGGSQYDLRYNYTDYFDDLAYTVTVDGVVATHKEGDAYYTHDFNLIEPY